MGRKVVCATDLSNTSIGGHDDNWCLIGLQSSVQIREAFNIEHMDLINKQYTWNNLGSTLLTPFSNFLINLLSNFRLDFTNISCEKGHEALCSRVNNINFMKRNSVDNLLSLLEFTLWCLNVSGLWASIIKVTATSERLSKL